MKIVLFTMLLITAWVGSTRVNAACGYTWNNSYKTAAVTIGTVYVQRDTPVGSVIATTPANVSNATNQLYQCDVVWSWSTAPALFTLSSALNQNIYETNVPGIGIRIRDTLRNMVVPYVKTNPMTSGAANTPFTIELIKTSSAPVKGGILTSGTLVYFKSLEDGVTFAQLDLTGNNAIVPVACSIMTPSLTFPIGDVLVDTFSGVIGTVPRQGGNTQNLGLDCDAGANINISLSGIQNPDVETTSVLALTGQGNEGVAKGVGVQLLYNDVPLELNNRIVLKLSTGGQESLPLTARYYQTQTEVTPGTANASATLNLTYQ